MKSNAHLLAPIALVLSTASWLPTDTAMSAPASTQDASAAAPQTLSADFESLAKVLKGKWTTLVYHGKGDENKSPPDHGEQVWRIGPGGLTLIEEEHIASRDGDHYVLALHWWDHSTNTLKGMLCNNSGSGACSIDSYYRSKLNWDGKHLTVDLVFPQGPKLMLWHEQFGDFTSDSFLQTGDIGEVGGPLERVITIHAKKVGAVPD